MFEHLTGGYVLAGFHEVVYTEQTKAALEAAKKEAERIARENWERKEAERMEREEQARKAAEIVAREEAKRNGIITNKDNRHKRYRKYEINKKIK